MKVSFEPLLWEDYPSINTPINAENLNRLEAGVAGLYEDMVEINTKLNGAFSEYVTDWLDEHVTPVGSAVVVDDSLTIQGAAADAKKTGDEISDLKDGLSAVESDVTDLKDDLTDVTDIVTATTGTVGNIYSNTGIQLGVAWNGTANPLRAVVYIPVSPLTTYTIAVPTNPHVNIVDAIEKEVGSSAGGSLRTTNITIGSDVTITTLSNTHYICLQFAGNTTLTQSDFENYDIGIYEGVNYLTANDLVAREKINSAKNAVLKNSRLNAKTGQVIDISGCYGFVKVESDDETADILITGENILPSNVKTTSAPVGVLLAPGDYVLSMNTGLEGKNWYIRLKTTDGDTVTSRISGFLTSFNFSSSSYWYHGGSSLNSIPFTLSDYYVVEFARVDATGSVLTWLNFGTKAKAYTLPLPTIKLASPYETVDATGYGCVYANKSAALTCQYMLKSSPQQRASQAKTFRPQLIANCTAESLNTNEKMNAYLEKLWECGFDGIALVVKFTTNDNGATIQEPATMSVIRYAYTRARELGLKIKAVKTHFEYLLGHWETMDFNTWWPAYLERCRALYDMDAEYFTILNEAYTFVYSDTHTESINNYLGELKQHGYKTGMTGFAVNADMFSNLDSENFHWYPSLTTKGTQATEDDCLYAFYACRDIDTLNNVQRRYKNLEYNVTESGCMRVWESLAYPPKNTWGANDHYDRENGLPQAFFFDALLQVANNCKLDSVWTYYDETIVTMPEVRNVFIKWTGGRSND